MKKKLLMLLTLPLLTSCSGSALYTPRYPYPGEGPEEAKLTDADAPDPLYPTFLGYSEYSSSIDEDHIWDFAKDYKQSNILKLYGIWVSRA